uniref:Uncharacterized protein n=1 Tax=Rhizophora mucronata TaxID=61149 RepID=A0A2P2PZY9_RHIMU
MNITKFNFITNIYMLLTMAEPICLRA